MAIRLNSIKVSFENNVVLDQFSATFLDHQITGIYGPSGIGKTTLLKLLSGLITSDSGEIAGLPQKDRISYVFQENRLLPWRTVHQNIEFVLTNSDEKEKVSSILMLVGLSDVSDQYPDQLSGGMAKRVALARAFCKSSDLLLMDEPFTGLDTALKNQIMDDFLKLWKYDQRTTILVSHDLDEINRLCSGCVVLK